MANKYVSITTSDNVTTKRFWVIQLTIVHRKSQSVDKTLAGTIDITNGANFKSYRMVFRIPYQTTDSNYATYADMQQIFMRNNPTMVPADWVTFTDHLGAQYAPSYIVGNMEVTPLTTILDTGSAWYLVPVEILTPLEGVEPE